MLDHEDSHESVHVQVRLQEKFVEALGELRPVSPDAVGVSDSKTILLRQALVHDYFTGLCLVTYPAEEHPVSRTRVKVTRSILETDSTIESLSSISVFNQDCQLAYGDTERFVLDRRNDEQWRYKVKTAGKKDAPLEVRVDRIATVEDILFFNEILDFAMHGNIRRIAGRDTVVDARSIGSFTPYKAKSSYSCPN